MVVDSFFEVTSIKHVFQMDLVACVEVKVDAVKVCSDQEDRLVMVAYEGMRLFIQRLDVSMYCFNL